MLENLTNLYEVIKTLKFELKPSKFTLKRCDFDRAFEADPHALFEKLSSVHRFQEQILDLLWKTSSKKIVIHKNLIKLIDADYFYQLKSKAISSNNTIAVLRQDFQEEFFNYIKEKFNRLHSTNYSLDYLLWADYLENPTTIDKKPTKSEIAFATKRYVHVIEKVEEILSNLIYKTWNIDREIESLLANYYNNQDLKPLLKVAKSYLQSYSPTSWFQVSKFGFNAKAIQKKVDVEKMEQEIWSLEKKMLDLEEKKIIATQIFDDYAKKFVQEKIKSDPKLLALRENQTASLDEIKRAKEYLKYLKEWDFDYQKILKERSKARKEKRDSMIKFTWDREYCELKLAKTDASVVYGRAKQAFFAKQQELYSQQALTHYARILRSEWNYFVAMIDRDDVSFLERLWTNDKVNNEKFEILRYASLTARAVEKLIFEKNALKFNIYDKEYKECKMIREKRSYKEKWNEDSRSKNEKQKENLKKLVLFLNSAIEQLNKKLEWWIFDWKPFLIWNDFDNFSEFQKYITENCYIARREAIDKQTIYDLDQKWKLNFYQIFNKDFSVDPYCATTERDRSSTIKNINLQSKKNLFTLYWQSLYTENSWTIRLNPESNLYFRPSRVRTEIDLCNDCEASKLRYRQNKIIGDFQLVFYPTKELPFNQLQQKILKNSEKSYAIGIDLGENSLATICLVDNEKKVVLDGNNKPIIKDLSMINNKWDFVEVEDCFIDWKPYERKQKLLIWGTETKPYMLGRHFPKHLQNKVIAEMSQDMLFEVLQILESLAPEKLWIVDKQWNKVFDYNYAFEHLKAINKIRYHLQVFNHTNDEMRILEKDLLASIKIRWWFVWKIVSYITQMAKKYNAIIVFENLDQEIGRIKWRYLFSEQSYAKVSPKEERMYKGISPYQLMQDKIIQKCNYLLTKQEIKGWMQISPRLKRQEDIKQLTLLKDKNCAWGKIIFVNEEDSSKECPNCGFVPWKYSSNINIKDDWIELMANKKDKKVFSFAGNQLLSERREAYQKISDIDKKKALLIETRVWKTFLKSYMDIQGDPMICVNCGYDTRKTKRVEKYNLKSCDEIAAYIIAKRWLEFMENKWYETQEVSISVGWDSYNKPSDGEQDDSCVSGVKLSWNISFS